MSKVARLHYDGFVMLFSRNQSDCNIVTTYHQCKTNSLWPFPRMASSCRRYGIIMSQVANTLPWQC